MHLPLRHYLLRTTSIKQNQVYNNSPNKLIDQQVKRNFHKIHKNNYYNNNNNTNRINFYDRKQVITNIKSTDTLNPLNIKNQ